MSSRYDNRRRDRSRDRDFERNRDRERGRYHDPPRRRSSRSRSPRRNERDRRPADRRDHGRDRDDDRRDRDRRDGGRRQDREVDKRDDTRDRDRDGRRDDRERVPHRDEQERDAERKVGVDEKQDPGEEPSNHAVAAPIKDLKERSTSEGHMEDEEEGEAMESTNADDEAMMAMMGMTGFGSTKGRHVEGNQEGSIDVKKQRTWRQYMNRRGGFNRPLDKIK